MADQFALVILNGQMERLPVADRLKVGAGIVFDNSDATIDDTAGVLSFTDINGTKSLTTMPVMGNTIIDFGVFPGKDIASALVSSATVTTSSFVSVKLNAIDTPDHSADEHIADGPAVYAGAPAAGSFTVYASSTQQLGARAYGKWSVAWSHT